MLPHRARRILFALVSEYIATGEPVSSSALVRGHGLELSSASIRAVFADLEALGCLHKPHTSAGRIPTQKGLRAFVDALLASGELTPEVRDAIEQRYADVGPGVAAALRHTGKVLAEVTGAAAVVVSLPEQVWRLKDLRFIAVRAHEVLAVIVASNGAVQNRVLRTEESLAAAELERANNILQPLLEGRTIEQVRQLLAEQMETERGRLDQWMCLALTLGERALARAEHGAEVVVEGQARLIGRPEFSDIDRARQALHTLEDRERLIQLLDRTLAAPGIQVLIGAEDAETGAGDLSVVAAPFGSGTLGVIGSTRMDYSSVVPAVRYTANLLARLLGAEKDQHDRNA
jgi:heat-inducible transcriptional repressor